ncbi:MAG: SUMF1/EgtB/PvdO family nonheme iron enzyme [Verrucomicrobia bacterium]|nr:SUMF1/EgtB/PvdO family nonheme iron enzyme [Verrucomicrobiota bacterium]
MKNAKILFPVLAIVVLALTATAEPPVQGQPWTNSLGMKFVPVPGTTVLFCIWDTRVKDFEAFVSATSHDATRNVFTLTADRQKEGIGSWKAPGFAQMGEHPVCCVNWNDAKTFCNWLTAKERREGRLLKEGQEYRLPTDAEWSVAVGLEEEDKPGRTPEEKDGKVKGYPWGRQWPPPAGAGNYAGEEAKNADWPSEFEVIKGYRDDYPRTSPVGSFKANRFGLYDMSGNVWQWCEDIYAPGSAVGGRLQECERVLRGGSWLDRSSNFLESSAREHIRSPNFRDANHGFRVVLAGASSR